MPRAIYNKKRWHARFDKGKRRSRSGGQLRSYSASLDHRRCPYLPLTAIADARFLPDEDDQVLAARDAGTDQIPLEHYVMLWRDGDHDHWVFHSGGRAPYCLNTYLLEVLYRYGCCCGYDRSPLSSQSLWRPLDQKARTAMTRKRLNC